MWAALLGALRLGRKQHRPTPVGCRALDVMVAARDAERLERAGPVARLALDVEQGLDRPGELRIEAKRPLGELARRLPLTLLFRFEEEAAPATCEAFRRLLPYRARVIQTRWSGEACWIPLGTLDLGLGHENHTSFPAPGDILLYPGGISETEILFPYGSTRFASKVGQLAGNHFLTVIEGRHLFKELGRLVL